MIKLQLTEELIDYLENMDGYLAKPEKDGFSNVSISFVDDDEIELSTCYEEITVKSGSDVEIHDDHITIGEWDLVIISTAKNHLNFFKIWYNIYCCR